MKLGRITAAEANVLQQFALCQEIQIDDYSKVKDAWIGRSGKVFYAGSLDNGHETTCKMLGYETVEACEDAGFIHVSSCFRNKITFAYIPDRPSKAQKDTLYDYCAAHNISMPIEY